MTVGVREDLHCHSGGAFLRRYRRWRVHIVVDLVAFQESEIENGRRLGCISVLFMAIEDTLKVEVSCLICF